MIPDTEAIIDASQYLPRSVENLEFWEDDNKLFFRDAFNKKNNKQFSRYWLAPNTPQHMKSTFNFAFKMSIIVYLAYNCP